MLDVLELPMDDNDAGASTIKEYLRALLLRLWEEGEGFSGKRPFGNSGWQWDLHLALVKGGAAKGTLDEDGCLDEHDEAECDRLIKNAIASL